MKQTNKVPAHKMYSVVKFYPKKTGNPISLVAEYLVKTNNTIPVSWHKVQGILNARLYKRSDVQLRKAYESVKSGVCRFIRSGRVFKRTVPGYFLLTDAQFSFMRDCQSNLHVWITEHCN